MGARETSFEKKTTTKKGTYGEKIVLDWILSRGCNVFNPPPGRPHVCDGMFQGKDGKIYAYDVKTKTIMSNWPVTGIDVDMFERYTRYGEETDVEVWLFFVDENLKEVYGNSLKNLESKKFTYDGKEFPQNMLCRKHGSNTKVLIRFWPYKSMIRILPLKKPSCEEMKKMNTRSYKYQDSMQQDLEPLDEKQKKITRRR